MADYESDSDTSSSDTDYEFEPVSSVETSSSARQEYFFDYVDREMDRATDFRHQSRVIDEHEEKLRKIEGIVSFGAGAYGPRGNTNMWAIVRLSTFRGVEPVLGILEPEKNKMRLAIRVVPGDRITEW